MRVHAVFVENHHLAVLDVADVFRADDVECAGLRGKDRLAVELPDHQRTDAERVARPNELLVGEADERIGAFELAQSLDETVDEAVAPGVGNEMEDDLGIGRRLHDGAVAHQLAPQREPVGQIAVVADRQAAAVELGEQRLHVTQDGLAGGGVAHVAHRGHAGQTLDHLPAGEVVPHETHAALGMEPLAVERDDARGLLPTVLKGMQAEGGDGSGIRMPEDAEDAALFPQPVAVQFGPAPGRRFAIGRSRIGPTAAEIEPGVAWSVGHLAHLLMNSWRGQRGAALPRSNCCMPDRSLTP